MRLVGTPLTRRGPGGQQNRLQVVATPPVGVRSVPLQDWTSGFVPLCDERGGFLHRLAKTVLPWRPFGASCGPVLTQKRWQTLV